MRNPLRASAEQQTTATALLLHIREQITFNSLNGVFDGTLSKFEQAQLR
jgi:hypothetical protein